MPDRYGLTVRAGGAADAEGVAELMRTAAQPIEARGLAARLEAISLEAGIVLLAEAWGPPTGVIALTWAWTLQAELRTARVATLLVDPERRRQGVARLLLKAASRAARAAGCGDLSLSSGIGDDLRAFCLATGFTEADGAFVRPLRKRG